MSDDVSERLGLDRVGTADDGQGIYKLSKEDVRIYLEGLQSIKETNEEIE